MIRSTFLLTTDAYLAPEYRSQYLTINQLIRWEFVDETGEHSGLLIMGEQILGIRQPPPGFLPSANMIIDPSEKELPAAKVKQLCGIVRGAFFDPHLSFRVESGSSTVQ